MTFKFVMGVLSLLLMVAAYAIYIWQTTRDLAALRAAPGSYQGPGFSRAGKGRSRIPALAAAYGKAHPKIGPAQYCR